MRRRLAQRLARWRAEDAVAEAERARDFKLQLARAGAAARQAALELLDAADVLAAGDVEQGSALLTRARRSARTARALTVRPLHPWL